MNICHYPFFDKVAFEEIRLIFSMEFIRLMIISSVKGTYSPTIPAADFRSRFPVIQIETAFFHGRDKAGMASHEKPTRKIVFEG